MKVSVFMITYNHKKYIAQALDSILAQQTNFDYEIVVGNDASTDGTGEILDQYHQKYPGKFKLLQHAKNIGAMQNQLLTLKNCTGDYIAICEGDDYWINTNKLQLQVDFMEAHPEYTVCFHRTYNLINDELVLSQLNTSATEETYTIEDLAVRNFITTPSVMFRNKLFADYPGWMHQSPVGDYVMHMLHAKYGLIKYFPEPMAVYRVHNTGVWSSSEDIKRTEKMVLLLNCFLLEDFNSSVIEILQKQLNKNQENHLKALMKNDDWTEFLKVLAVYSGENRYIAQKWLLDYYPKQIKAIKSSRAYRLAEFIKKLRFPSRKTS